MLNLKEIEIPELVEGKWYNLRTGRFISAKPSDYPTYIMNDEYKVAGTIDMIKRFFQINNLGEADRAIQDVVYEKISDIKVPSVNRTRIKENSSFFSFSLQREREPTKNVDHKHVVALTRDIAKIPDEILSKLCSFNLAGLNVKAKVIRVIDGDTFELAFFVPMKFLSERKTRYVGRARKPIEEIYALPYKDSDGFFTMMTVRSNGVDAAEHDTVEGIWAGRWFEHTFEKLEGIVYMNISIQDKYGRLLADIYEDENMTTNITKMLEGCLCPYTGKSVCEVYGGGTKSNSMKELPIITCEEQKEWKSRITFDD
jgi:endonuclease YncB( thermonuclease family)